MIKQKTHRECAAEDCKVIFKKRNGTDKYCSFPCKIKNVKPDLKLKKPIARVSNKRASEEKIYAKLRREFLEREENKICPITGEITTEVHHMEGRTGKRYLDTNTWLALSHEGHKKVELNPVWAKEKGYSRNRI